MTQVGLPPCVRRRYCFVEQLEAQSDVNLLIKHLKYQASDGHGHQKIGENKYSVTSRAIKVIQKIQMQPQVLDILEQMAGKGDMLNYLKREISRAYGEEWKRISFSALPGAPDPRLCVPRLGRYGWGVLLPLLTCPATRLF